MPQIDVVAEHDLPELIPLIRAYLDFYEVNPPDEAMLALSRSLIADPELEGAQFIARDETDPARPAIGFASLFWTWATTRGGGTRGRGLPHQGRALSRGSCGPLGLGRGPIAQARLHSR